MTFIHDTSKTNRHAKSQDIKNEDECFLYKMKGHITSTYCGGPISTYHTKLSKTYGNAEKRRTTLNASTIGINACRKRKLQNHWKISGTNIYRILVVIVSHTAIRIDIYSI